MAGAHCCRRCTGCSWPMAAFLSCRRPACACAIAVLRGKVGPVQVRALPPDQSAPALEPTSPGHVALRRVGNRRIRPMKTIALAVAAGALLAATQANAGSFPVNSSTGVGTGLVDQVAVRVYVHEGHRFCFYFDGWHGPGWYRCGFAHRRGLGWGGVYGWNDWSYGPYERLFQG